MREWEMEQDCFDWRLRRHATYNCRWTHDVIGVHRKTHTLSSQLLDKQHNFIFGVAGACADKIQLRFQKRSHAAAEPKNTLIAWAHTDGAQVVSRPVYFNVLFVLIQKRTKKIKSQICCPSRKAGPPPHLAQASAPARN